MCYSTSQARSKGRAVLSALLGVAALAWATPSARAQKANGEEQVSLYLNVEKNGGLVTGLGNRNFRLFIDGKSVPAHLEKPETPASIAMLVEYSKSSAWYFEDLDDALTSFTSYAVKGNWYALATYSMELEVNQDFTSLMGEITGARSELASPAWSEINTYDAVFEMLDKMGRLPGRRVLIVVGSGIDTFSEHTLDDVRKKVESENVVIFVAGAGSVFRGVYSGYLDSSGRMTLLQSQAFLQMLADSSGGFAWFPNQTAAFPSVIQGVMQSIETQYRLVYRSPVPRDGKFHKIKVEAFRIVDDKREDFDVLVRDGWR